MGPFYNQETGIKEDWFCNKCFVGAKTRNFSEDLFSIMATGICAPCAAGERSIFKEAMEKVKNMDTQKTERYDHIVTQYIQIRYETEHERVTYDVTAGPAYMSLYNKSANSTVRIPLEAVRDVAGAMLDLVEEKEQLRHE